MIDLRDLLAMLEGVQPKGGGQYMARCPGHNDKKASLAVSQGENGGIVMHCLAGCQVQDILDRLNLTMKDLCPPRETQPARKAPKAAAENKPKAAKKLIPLGEEMRLGGYYTRKDKDILTGGDIRIREKITREYVYEDRSGQPVLKVFRTENKSFPVAHRVENAWYFGDGGMTTLLYRLPQVMKAVKAKETVYLVEGEKDADTLNALGLCGTTNKGGAGKWGDAATQPLKGARVVIIPDIDEPGRKHGRLIAKALQYEADEVRIVDLRLSGVELPEKGDVSDLVSILGEEAARAKLQKMAANCPILFKRVDDSAYEDYFAYVPGCLVEKGRILAPMKNGHVPLCNFVALPIEETVLDDGQEQAIRLKIAGWDGNGRRLPDALVKAEEFSGMGWVVKNWALSACIEPGTTTKDKLRAIIQKAGALNAVRRTVYTHTGWRKVAGRPVFLHGGGAIGAEGIGVELGYGYGDMYDLSGMAEGVLPDADVMAKRQYAMGYTFKLMSLATLRVGVPLVAFMFLSPLRHFLSQAGFPPAFIPFLCGKSSNGKSVLASLALSHFGRNFHAQNHPASFENTVNGISLKLNVLKDMPLLIDDYHPEGDAKKKRAMDAVAQQISRMVGDGSVRSRMSADAGSREDKPARGTAFETGEQLPDVSLSGLARLYVIEIGGKDVPLGSERLSDLQERAREGVLAEAMRGYIEWLIPQFDRLPRELGERYSQLRTQATAMTQGAHKRLPSAAAHLMLGLEMMLKYAAHLDLVDEEDLPELERKYFDMILDNSRKQGEEMLQEKPSKMYLDTLRELLIAKRVTVRDLEDRQSTVLPNNIGCRDSQYYYFIPGQAFAAVQKAYQDQGQLFPVGKNAVAKMLREEKQLLASPDGTKNVRQLQRGGIKGWYQWIPRHILDNTQPAPEQMRIVVDEDNPWKEGEADE
ncbi:MAG: DUF927 domain-containing protein [Clostridia bacterium]|nr:DUF927 domain-containing protein [Clostridia bacterium]